MSHEISNLLSCYQRLSGDRSSERRKAAECLRGLLESDEVKDYIDSSSAGERGRGRSSSSSLVTWDGLFATVIRFMSRECESLLKLEHEKPAPSSASAQTSRKKMKQDVVDTIRSLLKAAHSRGGTLRVEKILDHVLSVLEHRHLYSWMGGDYSHMLLNNVLSCPQYLLDTSPASWIELLDVYCKLYQSSSSSSSSSLDRSVLARVIHTVISHCTTNCDLPTAKLFMFFQSATKNIVQEHNSTLLEHILAALNGYCTAVAASSRGRLCKLGEEVCPQLIQLWGRSPPPVKDQLMDFFRIQMRVHHPHGAHTDGEGAWARDDLKWKSVLNKLHELVLSECETTANRLRLASKGEASVSAVLIDLAADVIRQVLYIHETQESGRVFRRRATELSQPQTKWRRLDTGWSSLVDVLSSNSTNPSIVIWLQLIGHLLIKWPDSLPISSYPPLLTQLHKVQVETKKLECFQWLFVCMQSLACSSVARQHGQSRHTDGGVGEVWKKVWSGCIRTVQMQTAQDEGYSLLATLVERGLIEVDTEPWKLLHSPTALPTRSLVVFLATLLRHQHPPDQLRLTWSPLMDSTHTISSSYPLRCLFLHFLLPTSKPGSSLVQQEQHGGPLSVLATNLRTSNRPPVSLLAHLLVGLVQPSCSAIRAKHHSHQSSCGRWLTTEYRNSLASYDEVWSHVERVYMESSFDIDLLPPRNENCSCDTPTPKPQVGGAEGVVDGLLSVLLELLEEHAQLLMQPLNTDLFIISVPSSVREHRSLLAGTMEALGYHCSLTVSVTGLLCDLNVLSVDQALQLPAVKTLPSLLCKVCEGVKDRVWSDTEAATYYKTVHGTLISLHPLLDDACRHDSTAVKSLLNRCVPPALLEYLVSVTTGKWTVANIQPGSVASSTFSFTDSVANSFDDDMDVFDSVPSDHSDTPTSPNSPLDVVSPCLLSDRALCQFEAARFLTLWHCAGTSSSLADQNQDGDNECVVTAHAVDVWSTLNSLLSTEGRVLKQPKSMQLVLQVCTDLIDRGSHISTYTISTVIQSLRNVLSVHKKNNIVYKRCIDVLTSVIPLIVPEHSAESRQVFAPSTESKEPLSMCHYILSVFWTLYCSGELPVLVRYSLIDLLAALLKMCVQYNIDLHVTRKRKKRDAAADDGTKLTLRGALIRMLSDQDHGVRMHLAKTIVVLLQPGQDGEGSLLPSSEQDKLMDEVLKSLQAPNNDVQLDQDETSMDDESVSKLNSMSGTLQCMACVSPVCERRVMSVFASAVGHGHLHIDVVSKVIGRTATYLGYSSARKFLEEMVSELVCQWLNEGSLDRFPYSLMGMSSLEQFCKCYSSKIVPHLILLGKTDALKGMADHCKQPLAELVQASLPITMVFILTAFAQQDQQDSAENSQGRTATATRAHNYIIGLLGKEEFERCLKKSIGEFVVELLVRLYEAPPSSTTSSSPSSSSSSSSFLSQYLRACDPIPPSPFFSSHAITATLDYLPTCYNSVGSSFIGLISKRREKDTVQSILLSLNLRMLSTHRLFEQKRLFLAYSLFVNLVCQELKTGLADTVRFVVMDIVYSIIRIINMHKTRQLELRELFPPCCATLHTLCRSTVEACPQVLGSHIHTIVSTMIPFAQHPSPLGKQALGLLEYLMEQCQTPKLIEFAALLDPFPSQDPFSELAARWHEIRDTTGELSLAEEISRFLSLWQQKQGSTSHVSCSSSPSAEGLQCLRSLLHSSHCELKYLLGRSGSQGCSPVIDLIRALISIAQQSPTTGVDANITIATEVGRCLGEIGCVDLSCIAIPDNTLEVVSIGKQPSLSYGLRVLEKLSHFLSDPSIEVVHASAECLKTVLSTKTGAAALSKAEDELGGQEEEGNGWCSLLEPFKQQKKKKKDSPCQTPPPPSLPPVSAFSQLVDTSTLWVPRPQDHTHRQWITTLVTTLLSSGGVKDEVLLLLEPVCAIKVELCEEVFPMIVHHILSTGTEEHRSILSRQVSNFFSSVTASSSLSPSSSFSSTTTSMSLSAGVPSESIRTMLHMIMFLRATDRTAKSTAWGNNFWLELDFLTIAHAARLCSAYFTSLLYIEIWHCAQRDKERKSVMESALEPMDTTPSSSPSSTCSSAPLDNRQVQSLLLDVYSKIGEPDGLYGACYQYAVQDNIRTKMFEYENKWEKALSAYNWQMKLGDSGHAHSGVLQALHRLNLPHMTDMYMQGLGQTHPQETEEMSEFRYEAAWRCSLWENEEDRMLSNSSLASGSGDGGRVGYHEHLYSCLSSLKEGKMSAFQTALTAARMEAVRSLCSEGMESVSSIYPGLSKLQALVELEAVGETLSSNDLSVSSLLSSWQERLQYMDTDYIHKEPVLALRCSSLHAALKHLTQQMSRSPSPTTTTTTTTTTTSSSSSTQLTSTSSTLYDGLNHALLSQAELAREAGRYQVANGALFTLKHLHKQPQMFGVSSRLATIGLMSATNWRGMLEEAKLMWASGEESLAMLLMKNLLKTIESHSIPANAESVYISALSMYGSWLDDTRSENPLTIMETYLEQAVSIQNKHHNGDHQMMHAYFVLARYADSQYQKISRRISLPDFQAKLQQLRNSKMELERMNKGTPGKGAARRVRTMTVHNREDESTIQSMEDDKFRFLMKALENYILCLKTGDDHDLRVFRMCSLWFNNAADQDVNDTMKDAVTQVESRKFLPLLYQLAARISEHTLDSDPFQQILQEIIFKTAVDHPYHSLYIILALSNACKDDEFPQSGYVTGSKSSRSHTKLHRSNSEPQSNVDEDKVNAARNLIAKLRSEKSSLVTTISQLCEAYTDLAYHDVTAFRKQTSPIKLPPSCPLLKLTKLKSVPLPTVELQVDPTCKYTDLVCIESFDTCINLCGGINLPKVISCVGTDGKRRRQLVKGKDDLRQDAVMQQVFVLVNRLLAREPATTKRHLSIRVYKVVPLTQRSGIVEWCEGTISLGCYLIGTPQCPAQGAHMRYHPKDWSNAICRKKLMEAGNSKSAKLSVYNKICQHFQPVFHHFFMESFPSPPQWFEHQLAYTRSVAASSIVGYVVGLGDRHVQNILIDKKSAELIHIDLGVAFEEGMALPTPETVPFRLTRDLVDGMGIAGVEGVFRRCCEETMRVMRASHEELRTIVEVLIHDPLYLWKLSPLKARDIQRRRVEEETANTSRSHTTQRRGTSGNTDVFADNNGCTAPGETNTPSNKMAERVLRRLHEKLEGEEDGVQLSVSGHVNHLIQEATDPANLSALFHGWQSWI